MPPPNDCTVKVTTLTPVWTGDVDIKTSYLKATSFIGNLRFWAEALLRAQGKRVCDITGDSPCNYEQDRGANGICSVCNDFGCTGLGRSFLLRVREENFDNTRRDMPQVRLHCRRYTQNGEEKTPIYLDGNQGKWGCFTLQLVPGRPGGLSPTVAAALVLALRWGSLGARDQYGFGLVQAEPMPDQLVQVAGEVTNDTGSAVPLANRPNLRDFYFFKARASYRDDETSEELTSTNLPFVIRHDVRNRLRGPADRNRGKSLRHRFCGTIENSNSKQGTWYTLALADDMLYGWGWFPRHGTYASHRDRCLDALHTELKRHSEKDSLQWQEFCEQGNRRNNTNSSRDWQDYLGNLLTTTWRGCHEL